MPTLRYNDTAIRFFFLFFFFPSVRIVSLDLLLNVAIYHSFFKIFNCGYTDIPPISIFKLRKVFKQVFARPRNIKEEI